MIPITRLSLGLAILGSLACAPQGGAIGSSKSKDAVAGSVIRVDRPTVVAFFDTSSAGQTDPNADEAYADFQYYLPATIDSLRTMGVAVQVRYTPAFAWQDGTARSDYSIPADSARVGYVFLAPARAPIAIFGVMTDSDLIAWCRELLVPA